MTGDMYNSRRRPRDPEDLREAADLLNGSAMLRAAFGDDVIDHYHHAAQWEIPRPTAS
jgi:glutamine synthetase